MEMVMSDASAQPPFGARTRVERQREHWRASGLPSAVQAQGPSDEFGEVMAHGEDALHVHAGGFEVAVVRSPPKFVVSLVVLRRTTERVKSQTLVCA